MKELLLPDSPSPLWVEAPPRRRLNDYVITTEVTKEYVWSSNLNFQPISSHMVTLAPNSDPAAISTAGPPVLVQHSL